MTHSTTVGVDLAKNVIQVSVISGRGKELSNRSLSRGKFAEFLGKQKPALVAFEAFVDWAAQTINKSAWAAAYYRQQRAKGCSYQVAVRALAFKWIRILHRCWQNRTPYDESKYLEALRRKGSPLLKYLAAAA